MSTTYTVKAEQTKRKNLPSKIIKTYKKELKLSNCGFNHDPVESMVRSQWQSRSKNNIYLAYRMIVAIFVTAVVINSIYSHLTKYQLGTFFIYLTHWGIMINMLTGIYGAILVTVWHFHTDYSGNVLYIVLIRQIQSWTIKL